MTTGGRILTLNVRSQKPSGKAGGLIRGPLKAVALKAAFPRHHGTIPQMPPARFICSSLSLGVFESWSLLLKTPGNIT
jgi:hypothetical protein